jgi:hypothetical protein
MCRSFISLISSSLSIAVRHRPGVPRIPRGRHRGHRSPSPRDNLTHSLAGKLAYEPRQRHSVRHSLRGKVRSRTQWRGPG